MCRAQERSEIMKRKLKTTGYTEMDLKQLILSWTLDASDHKIMDATKLLAKGRTVVHITVKDYDSIVCNDKNQPELMCADLLSSIDKKRIRHSMRDSEYVWGGMDVIDGMNFMKGPHKYEIANREKILLCIFTPINNS